MKNDREIPQGKEYKEIQARNQYLAPARYLCYGRAGTLSMKQKLERRRKGLSQPQTFANKPEVVSFLRFGIQNKSCWNNESSREKKFEASVIEKWRRNNGE